MSDGLKKLHAGVVATGKGADFMEFSAGGIAGGAKSHPDAHRPRNMLSGQACADDLQTDLPCIAEGALCYWAEGAARRLRIDPGAGNERSSRSRSIAIGWLSVKTSPITSIWGLGRKSG